MFRAFVFRGRHNGQLLSLFFSRLLKHKMINVSQMVMNRLFKIQLPMIMYLKSPLIAWFEIQMPHVCISNLEKSGSEDTNQA